MDRPKATPIVVLEIIGLSICMALGFGVAFYAGYNSMPYVLPPAIFMDVACATCLTLHSRYLRGMLFVGDNLKNIKGSYWLGIVLLLLSIGASLYYAITGFGHTGGIDYEAYGLYAALVPSLLSVLWSAVLILESRKYSMMWEGTPTYGVKQFNMFP